MIKTLIKAMYSAFISIVLISFILVGWTTYSFIFQSSKSIEIAEVIQDIYSSQKSVAFDLIDLSKILIKDYSKEITNENNNVFVESELLVDIEEDSQLDQTPIIEDNGDNPLGIVIEPSSPEVSDERLPDIIEKSIPIDQNESPRMEMEMNS
mgnify:CR=1 FL=1